ncbi:MAG: hypothetical protein HN975_15325 [Anaerolineae bacterium]|jgi:hypothetical protein|nr:hypothetical protein [Anaerolineae bacterium]
MIKNLEINKKIWLSAAFLSLIAALVGVFNQDVYSAVLRADLLPGTISQDFVTILAAIVLLFLSLKTDQKDTKKQIVILSLLAYIFYGYGIYVIERMYNGLYLLYIAIFSLSFWALIYSLINIDKDLLKNIQAANWLRNLSAGFLIFTAFLFYFLWTSQLLPLMRTGERIDFLYSIYILDMAFVLPAILISATLVIKRNPLGLVFAPILFSKAFTLLFSVGLGSFLKPFFNQIPAPGETAFYIVLSMLFLVLMVLSLWKTRFQE